MTTIGFLQSIFDWLLADPTHVAVAAAFLAAITPTPNPNTLQGKLYKVLELLAFNFLHAKDTGIAKSGSDISSIITAAVAEAVKATPVALPPVVQQPQPMPTTGSAGVNVGG